MVATNAVLLVAACLVTILVISPRTISSFAFDEAVVLAIALALVALVNALLVRRAVAPLQALNALARRVNLSNPGQRIPETELKWGVGVLLSAFGLYFAGVGLGVHWPGDDAAILYLAAILAISSQAQSHRLAREAQAA